MEKKADSDSALNHTNLSWATTGYTHRNDGHSRKGQSWFQIPVKGEEDEEDDSTARNKAGMKVGASVTGLLFDCRTPVDVFRLLKETKVAGEAADVRDLAVHEVHLHAPFRTPMTICPCIRSAT